MGTSRSYTVREIDDLRIACENKWLFGVYDTRPRNGFSVRSSRPYRGSEKTRAVEEMVRTHMLAGHTAKDLWDSEAHEFRGSDGQI